MCFCVPFTLNFKCGYLSWGVPTLFTKTVPRRSCCVWGRAKYDNLPPHLNNNWMTAVILSSDRLSHCSYPDDIARLWHRYLLNGKVPIRSLDFVRWKWPSFKELEICISVSWRPNFSVGGSSIVFTQLAVFPKWRSLLSGLPQSKLGFSGAYNKGKRPALKTECI